LLDCARDLQRITLGDFYQQIKGAGDPMLQLTISCLVVIWTVMVGFKIDYAASADENFHKEAV
jgi:hypothetical protein